MTRSKGNKRPRVCEDSLRSDASQELVPCVQNREYGTRMSILMNRANSYEIGIQVKLSEKKINEHLCTVPVSRDTLPFGYASFNGDSEDLAKLLGGSKDGV
ncbi:hypothetical protein Ddye_019396 [Dipteronia dyeriana]|uniref:Uncharacterized protein n=1 Tax=Dipteronia dyeriana TaxID=168575 RepID=A0AAD9TXW6_9ROSI|nr:hypothetical protein Ddye_019396 [Dipteronia dyeriana]